MKSAGDLMSIEVGTAYQRIAASGSRQIRFVDAAGDNVAPEGHALHGRPAVRYRRLLADKMGVPRLCSIAAFRRWAVEAEAYPPAAELVREHDLARAKARAPRLVERLIAATSNSRPGPLPLARIIADRHACEGLILARDNLATDAQLYNYMRSFSGMEPLETIKAAIIGLAGAVIELQREMKEARS